MFNEECTELHVSIDVPDVYRILNVLLLIKKRNFISQLDSCLLWYHVHNMFLFDSQGTDNEWQYHLFYYHNNDRPEHQHDTERSHNNDKQNTLFKCLKQFWNIQSKFHVN
jgi:hypothetical protein